MTVVVEVTVGTLYVQLDREKMVEVVVTVIVVVDIGGPGPTVVVVHVVVNTIRTVIAHGLDQTNGGVGGASNCDAQWSLTSQGKSSSFVTNTVTL